jgi:hypothetical protein
MGKSRLEQDQTAPESAILNFQGENFFHLGR